MIWLQFEEGGLRVLGGVMGRRVMLSDFAPLVEAKRVEWFGPEREVWHGCDPAGTHQTSHGVENAVTYLRREFGIAMRTQPDANMPQVGRAMIERLSGYMRRRLFNGEEAFLVDDRRWRIVTATNEGWDENFCAQGLEGGYVWREDAISVGNKPMMLPLKDGWFEHSMNCLEYGELLFGGLQVPEQALRARVERMSLDRVRREQRDSGETFRWDRTSRASRGGW